MSTPSAINKPTFKRISVRLPGEKDEGDEGKGVPMETEAEAIGHALTSTPRRSGKRTRASAKGLEHQLLQIHLQMLFKSFWNDLMGSEESRLSTLKG